MRRESETPDIRKRITMQLLANWIHIFVTSTRIYPTTTLPRPHTGIVSIFPIVSLMQSVCRVHGPTKLRKQRNISTSIIASRRVLIKYLTEADRCDVATFTVFP